MLASEPLRSGPFRPDETDLVAIKRKDRLDALEWIRSFDQTNGPLHDDHVLARLRMSLQAPSG